MDKKVAIVVDNYKLPKFKDELDESKFEYEVKNGSDGLTSHIYVVCDESRIIEIKKIVTMLEYHFKRSN